MHYRMSTALLIAGAMGSNALWGAEWVGGSGFFADPARWLPPVVPGAMDAAAFHRGGMVTFDADVRNARLEVGGPAATTLLLAGASGTTHTYTLTDNALLTGTTVAISGGRLVMMDLLLAGSTLHLGSQGQLSAIGRVAIDGGLNIASQSSLMAGEVHVGTSGTGIITVLSQAGVPRPRSTLTVIGDVAIAIQQGSTGTMQVLGSEATAQGSVYVGGSAAGRGGVGSLEVDASGGAVNSSTLHAKRLLVYPGSTLLLNNCSGIFTTVSEIAGTARILSELGSGGGLSATTSITLLPGSHTTVASSLSSPLITVSAGAVLTAERYLRGRVINSGELWANRVRVHGYAFGEGGDYSQLESGVLAGVAGPDALLTAVPGTAEVDGTLRLIFSDPSAVRVGDSFPVISATSIRGGFDKVDLVGVYGLRGEFSTLTGRVIMVVPEPGSLWIAGGLGLWLFISRRMSPQSRPRGRSLSPCRAYPRRSP